LSVIGGLTPAGQVLLQAQDRAYRGPDVVRYLKHLLRHIAGRLLVIWDGSPIHRAQPVKDFLAHGGGARIQLEQFPGYAPELNPAEGLWQQLKQIELRNVCCRDLAHLRVEFRRAVERLRHKSSALHSCATRCGYTV
jgi:putative transposase